MMEDSRIQVGISSCLLGNQVRYDGGHSRNANILESMQDLFELIGFCPEVAIGLSTPRPPINLVSVAGEIRVRGVSDTTHDVTDALSRYALSGEKQFISLCGYIFKSKSPSCGLVEVNVYDAKTKQLVGTSAGQFAKIMMQQYPGLPVADEIQLSDKHIRQNFIRHVLDYSKMKNC